jgi:hypothetical protein
MVRSRRPSISDKHGDSIVVPFDCNSFALMMRGGHASFCPVTHWFYWGELRIPVAISTSGHSGLSPKRARGVAQEKRSTGFARPSPPALIAWSCPKGQHPSLHTEAKAEYY